MIHDKVAQCEVVILCAVIILLLLILSCGLLVSCTSSPAEAKPWEPPRPCAQLRAGWAVYSMGWFEAGYKNHTREVFILHAPDGRRWVGVTGASLEEWQTSDGENTTNHEE